MRLQFGTDFAKLVGLKTYLFGGLEAGPGGQYVTSRTHNLFSYDDGAARNQFSHEINYQSPDQLGTIFASKKPFLLLDQRQSVDLELTIPTSHVIDADNGEYKEKYRLASFAINTYINTQSKIVTKDGISMPSIKLTDSLQGGLVDLTEGYGESVVKHFLPGAVQAINVRIFCTYRKWTGERAERSWDLDGFWDLELLFLKKVT